MPCIDVWYIRCIHTLLDEFSVTRWQKTVRNNLNLGNGIYEICRYFANNLSKNNITMYFIWYALHVLVIRVPRKCYSNNENTHHFRVTWNIFSIACLLVLRTLGIIFDNSIQQQPSFWYSICSIMFHQYSVGNTTRNHLHG